MNLHSKVPPVSEALECSVVHGDYRYWHYLCDGTDDRGWGCGYRTLQTIIDWCLKNVATLRKGDKNVTDLKSNMFL